MGKQANKDTLALLASMGIILSIALLLMAPILFTLIPSG